MDHEDTPAGHSSVRNYNHHHCESSRMIERRQSSFKVVRIASMRAPPMTVVLCWTLLVSILGSSLAAASTLPTGRSVAILASSTATEQQQLSTSSSPTAATTAATDNKSSPNAVAQLFHYLQDSVVKTVDGCKELWSNHGRCNDIRSKLKAYRDQLAVTDAYVSLPPKQKRQLLAQQYAGGISFEEYHFLQKGKEDRGKVMSLVFLMWGAPRILPYALLFNPTMLPSPFARTSSAEGKTRATALLQTLLQLENEPFAKKNPLLFWSRQKSDTPSQVLTQTQDWLSSPSPTAASALQRAEQWLFRSTNDFTRAEQRLVGLPKSVVTGLGNAVTQTSGGFLASLSPQFLQRGKLVGHLQKVTEADQFLRSINAEDMDSIPQWLLKETCHERLIEGSTIDECKQGLQEWLELTEQPEGLYFNGNLARTILLGYYGMESLKKDGLILPRLLYSGSSSSSVAPPTVDETKTSSSSWIPFRK